MRCSYRRRIAALTIQLAKEDPQLVKEVLARLRMAGEIEPDDLVHLDKIADRWIGIARAHRERCQRSRVVSATTPKRRLPPPASIRSTP